MHDDTSLFLDRLLSRCPSSTDLRLTLTAMHPDGQHLTPSRHVPVHQSNVLHDALERLEIANRCGWGAFFGVGLRKTGLSRYRRGGLSDITLLPALFVDIDDPSESVLQRLEKTQPLPSCIVFSGGGYHAYWWLETPTHDLVTAKHLLRSLASSLDGDHLSPAQSLRLPGSCNTKPIRHNILCELVHLTDQMYALSDFAAWGATSQSDAYHRQIFRTSQTDRSRVLNPDLIDKVVNVLNLAGYRLTGNWVKGPCLFPQRHRHGDDHPSFGFNWRTGYGHCFRCGSILLKDICHCLSLSPSAYGGLCSRT